jgi:hypothetical protein
MTSHCEVIMLECYIYLDCNNEALSCIEHVEESAVAATEVHHCMDCYNSLRSFNNMACFIQNRS